MTPNTPAGEELKACPVPWCQSAEAAVRYVAHNAFVRCPNCGATGPSVALPSDAIAAWNRRPAPEELKAGVTYRHLKRGTEYEIVGVGELQMANDPLCDGSEMVIYRGDDGKLWVREESEFLDGRFEVVPTPEDAPQQGEVTQDIRNLVHRLLADKAFTAQRVINGKRMLQGAVPYSDVLEALAAEAASARISGGDKDRENPVERPAAPAASGDVEELPRLLGALGRLLQFGSLLEDCTTDPEQKFSIRYNVGLLKSALEQVLSSPEEKPLMVPRHATDAMMNAGLYHCSADMQWADLFTAWTAMFDAIAEDGGCTAELPAAPTQGEGE